MEYALLGWPPDGPQLDLDHRSFRYAGKFVMPTTGKAVVRESPAAGSETVGDVVAAVAFNEDRTDSGTLCLRTVTVRTDHQGEGIGPRLLAFAAERALERGYDRVRIAVNNPFAYQAAWKAGFGYAGEETGMAEVVCLRPGDRSPERYQAGLDVYRERDLADEEVAFLQVKADADPPQVVEAPSKG